MGRVNLQAVFSIKTTTSSFSCTFCDFKSTFANGKNTKRHQKNYFTPKYKNLAIKRYW